MAIIIDPYKPIEQERYAALLSTQEGRLALAAHCRAVMADVIEAMPQNNGRQMTTRYAAWGQNRRLSRLVMVGSGLSAADAETFWTNRSKYAE